MAHKGWHFPVGAYLPIGQLDGDCSCGRGEYPCAEVVALVAWLR